MKFTSVKDPPLSSALYLLVLRRAFCQCSNFPVSLYIIKICWLNDNITNCILQKFQRTSVNFTIFLKLTALMLNCECQNLYFWMLIISNLFYSHHLDLILSLWSQETFSGSLLHNPVKSSFIPQGGVQGFPRSDNT